jgi:lysophospholipase L1-like esterase
MQMKHNRLLRPLSICVLLAFLLFNACLLRKGGQASDSAIVNLSPDKLVPIGRTRLTVQGLELITTAAHFSVEFSGKDCKVTMNLAKGVDIGYIQYELDGQYGQRVRITKGSAKELLISAASAGKHKLSLFKTTEAASGGIIISNIQAIGARPLAIEKKPLIEFIGNSITCGAASDNSEIPCGTGSYADHHNAYMAYGPRLARALNCEFVINSVSGIGCYRNWNTNGPTMPQVYRKQTLNISNTTDWNFKQFKPDIISCALGTNDMSNGDGKQFRAPFDSDKFVATYIDFLIQLRTLHPHVKLALLNSAMKKGNPGKLLESCLARIKESIDRQYPQDTPLALIYFQEMTTQGCGGHPSVEDHEIMARDVSPSFAKLLKQ